MTSRGATSEVGGLSSTDSRGGREPTTRRAGAAAFEAPHQLTPGASAVSITATADASVSASDPSFQQPQYFDASDTASPDWKPLLQGHGCHGHSAVNTRHRSLRGDSGPVSAGASGPSPTSGRTSGAATPPGERFIVGSSVPVSSSLTPMTVVEPVEGVQEVKTAKERILNVLLRREAYYIPLQQGPCPKGRGRGGRGSAKSATKLANEANAKR
eukprot:GHVU01148265.1.p2 GENE.GHVU01148265.1~~GHVU01148265.1.p2  ORF type:complete len:214 (+),score=32.01 GHVU01148265.1:540-1181(+)